MAKQAFEASCRGYGSANPDPCLMVIFGASGDLTQRALLPSLFELAQEGLLPEPFAVLGVAISDWDDDGFRRRMRDAVSPRNSDEEQRWEDFVEKLYYLSGDFESEDSFDALRARVDQLRDSLGLPDNLLFHLAVPPVFFASICEHLDRAGLAHSGRETYGDDGDGWRRVIIEKPFGQDRSSARALHRDLQRVFAERQLYRIDHFLGKETVQNMLVFRFANPSFEPIWNHRFVDQVQITVAEDIGIGTRGDFYEKTGVVRDMVQNHLLSLLSMVAMEPPVSYDARSLRNETGKVLQAIEPPQAADCVAGQYEAGRVDGKAVRGYREEDDVASDSTTATFAAVKLRVNNWRWTGVPFYLRTGKRMAQALTEVSVHFKPVAHPMFPHSGDPGPERNLIAFRVKPEEGILHTFIAKQPGSELCLAPVTSRFLYAEAFGIERPPRAYAWLILDAMAGQQTLFAREDWVDEAWRIVDPLVERLERQHRSQLHVYAAGTWGPPAAAELLALDGRRWLQPENPVR
jgi:glucose-6-phosphate 1-dehydrogenase